MSHGFDEKLPARGAMPWLLAGAAIVVTVFGIAFAVTLTGNTSSAGPPKPHRPQVAAAAPSVTDTAPAPSGSPTKSARPARAHTPSPSPAPASSTSQPHSPAAPPAPTPHPSSPKPAGSVQLTATVNGWSHSSSSSGTVVFEIGDTGSVTSAQVTATITLPAGTTMTSGGGGGGGGGDGGDATQRAFDGGSGWSCQSTSTGATCTHSGIAAGSQAWGAISFAVSGSPVCDQPVDLNAVAGSASASASTTVSC